MYQQRWASANKESHPAVIDLDVCRATNILLKRYGDEAVFIASRRADELFELLPVYGTHA